MSSSLTSCAGSGLLRSVSAVNAPLRMPVGSLPANHRGAPGPAANGSPPSRAGPRRLALSSRSPREAGADWRRRRPMGGAREERGQ